MPATVNQYEGMFLLGPAGADAEKAQTIVRTLIEKHGGQITVIKKWDERKLAYEIDKTKRGTYVLAYFKAAGSVVVPLERDVKLGEDVMRVLVIRADHMSEAEMNAVEPQPIAPPPERNSWDMPQRSDRPDRPSRGPRRDESAESGGTNKD